MTTSSSHPKEENAQTASPNPRSNRALHNIAIRCVYNFRTNMKLSFNRLTVTPQMRAALTTFSAFTDFIHSFGCQSATSHREAYGRQPRCRPAHCRHHRRWMNPSLNKYDTFIKVDFKFVDLLASRHET
eukprot:1352835-Amorphochlora_amoeboformis.AAC.1